MESVVDKSRKSWLFSAELSSSLQRIIKKVVTSSLCSIMITKAVVDSQDFIAFVIELVRTEIGHQLDSRSKRDERCHRYVEESGSMRTRLTWSSEGPPKDTLDDNDKINWRAYCTSGSDELPLSSQKELFVKDQVPQNTKKRRKVSKNRWMFLNSS